MLTKRTLPNSNLGFGPVAASNEIPIAERAEQLTNYFIDGEPLPPAVPVTDTYGRNVMVRVLMVRKLVNAGNSFSSHVVLTLDAHLKNADDSG